MTEQTREQINKYLVVAAITFIIGSIWGNLLSKQEKAPVCQQREEPEHLWNPVTILIQDNHIQLQYPPTGLYVSEEQCQKEIDDVWQSVKKTRNYQAYYWCYPVLINYPEAE